MATERFRRLPEEKQQTILEAGFREFARVSIDKVSINQIIHDADISRGSFYTYFEDKWDLLRCICETGSRDMKRKVIGRMASGEWELWDLVQGIFDYMIQVCQNSRTRAFIRNMLQHVSASEFSQMVVEPAHGSDFMRTDAALRCFFDQYIHGKYPRLSYARCKGMLEMATFAIGIGLREYMDGADEDKVRKDFQEKLSILRFGTGEQA